MGMPVLANLQPLRRLLPGRHSHPARRVKPCTNPDCKDEYFRPFSCTSFYLYPSCSQKETLLFSVYMNERLLLVLPHRQFAFTFPKLLRPYFRHNRRLFSEVSRLIFAILERFYNHSAKRPVRLAVVLAFQSAGAGFRFDRLISCPLFFRSGRSDGYHNSYF